ncbi:lichenan-specific phosphotransferase enzyme IIA component [Oceanobacillus oncorhynchi subsp. incaldanensis]|uniref:Lichenan-specific phosphotransferase enzyme IIA component n=1 Tax=Oceanobacillus oncorhynchi TaxID=545501 RepID=A0A0A1MMP8_9BACI|nr:PTS lactose/cellobiose transporter subunit IIA [Oceanobacillus oncorhynchi]GIO19576.1 lichenan-specific phosphotransferase enzyme IIA component [Oceanobacillus oncorhynchi subsp. incaldanensis]CEI80952.1 Lichenan-specific phosphotransferase enzyme IIA component [Oceanobacillus oncorhynchi]
MKNITEIAFQIILYAGNGRSSAMEAIQEAKEGNFEEAESKLIEAGEELNKAHEFQTNLLQGEANGKSTEINIILIHSQDHLMNAMTVRDLATEIIELYHHKN